MKIFQLDERNNKITLTAEIQTIKEFREIVKRDRGSEGDADGRKKYRAIKELTYIYHMCDYNSFCRERPEEETQSLAIEESGVKDLDKFKADDPLILAAIEKYKFIQNSTRIMRLLISMRKAVDDSIKFCENFNAENVDDVKKILSIPAEVTKANKALKELEEQVKLELTEKRRIQGDAEKGIREDE